MAINSRVTQVGIAVVEAFTPPPSRVTQVGLIAIYPYSTSTLVTQVGAAVIYPYVAPATGAASRAYFVGV